jgi:DNA-directed RNA polymerase subunit L
MEFLDFHLETFINQTLLNQQMEFKVLEETKTKLVFQLIGENHTFCNALKAELVQIKGVNIATYRIDHPLVGVPKFLIETSSIEPRKALKEALANLKKRGAEFKKEAGKL